MQLLESICWNKSNNNKIKRGCASVTHIKSYIQMRKKFYNSRKIANCFDSETLSYIGGMHLNIGRWFDHLKEIGIDIPLDEAEAFKRWHQETSVRLGLPPSGKYGKETIQNQEMYSVLTMSEYMSTMTFHIRSISRFIKKRRRIENEYN